MINSLDEAITHCLEVAEEQEDFDKFQCGYCKLGCEDGVWKDTCRLSSNIPEGCSWGECSESNCPLFTGCLECAKEHRQLAEWLRELKAFHDAMDIIPTTPFDVDLGEIPINNRSYDDIVKCLMIAYERGKNDTLSLIEQYILEEATADE